MFSGTMDTNGSAANFERDLLATSNLSNHAPKSQATERLLEYLRHDRQQRQVFVVLQGYTKRRGEDGRETPPNSRSDSL